jgi:hypothetical protein
MVSNLVDRALGITACLLLLLFIGCESGPTGPSIPGTSVVTADEGTTFTYIDHYAYQSQDSWDTTGTELLSKIATIGGRKDLLAYQWLDNGVISYWDVDFNGDMWMFYIVDPTLPGEETGVWIPYPTSGSQGGTTVIWDTALSNGMGNTHRYRDRQTSRFVGTESILIDGRTYLARVIETHYESDRWENGVKLIDDSYAYDVVQSFITGLGVVARSSVKLENDDYTSTRMLVKIER